MVLTFLYGVVICYVGLKYLTKSTLKVDKTKKCTNSEFPLPAHLYFPFQN